MKNLFAMEQNPEKQVALKEINDISMAERTTASQIVIDVDGFTEAGHEDCEEKVFDIVGKEVAL